MNVPPGTTEIPRGAPRSERVESLDGAPQGTNGFDELGYRGPLPPEGDGPHTYVFTLSAPDRRLEVAPGARRDALADAMADHVLAEATLRGTYER